MADQFTKEKNRKAFIYTLAICTALALITFLISWRIAPPTPPVENDLIEINLGNDLEGFGTEQPLIKGEPGPAATELAAPEPTPAPATNIDEAPVAPIEDNSNEEKTVTIPKVEKIITAAKPNAVVAKTNNSKAVTTTAGTTTTATKPAVNAPKVATPQRPRYTYNGPGAGTGNNATEDNGYRSQGNNPGGTGDHGSPTGNKDSYGSSPGGRIGGPKVISGNRSLVVRHYSFSGDLLKATIYALINVSPEGVGSFTKIVKPSTSFSNAYATAIQQFLRTMRFNKSDEASQVTVQFNFEVN